LKLGAPRRRRREGEAEDAGVVDISGMDHLSNGRLAAGGDRRDVNPNPIFGSISMHP
jgi:hypothetical protein